MSATERIFAKAGAKAEDISVAASQAKGMQYDGEKEVEAYEYGLEQRKNGNGQDLELLIEATDYLDSIGESGIMEGEALSIYMNSSDELYNYAKNIKAIDGFEDMIIHGDKFGFEVRDKNGGIASVYTPREFAEILREDPNYHGGNIRLISCETGAEDVGAAQMLANQLNVIVMAPTDILWILPDGKITIGPTWRENTGKWKIFKPKGELKIK